MKTGEAILVTGGLFVGGYLLYRFVQHMAAPSPMAAPPGAPPVLKVTPTVIVPPLPGLGPAYAVLNPIATHITTPIINKLNSTFGTSPGPYAGLTKNPDGTYTNGFGDIVTFNKNGTQTITAPKNASWWEKNVGGPISSDATGAVHAIENIF